MDKTASIIEQEVIEYWIQEKKKELDKLPISRDEKARRNVPSYSTVMAVRKAIKEARAETIKEIRGFFKQLDDKYVRGSTWIYYLEKKLAEMEK